MKTARIILGMIGISIIIAGCENNSTQQADCTISGSNIYFETHAGTSHIIYEAAGDFQMIDSIHLKLGSLTNCYFQSHIDSAISIMLPNHAPFGNVPHTYQLLDQQYFGGNNGFVFGGSTQNAYGEFTFNTITPDSFATGTFYYGVKYSSPVIHYYDQGTGTYLYTDTFSITNGTFTNVKIIN